MCGILGISQRIPGEKLDELSALMGHRGPDDSGNYVSDNMSLAHRRLSIIDLKTGRQPMSNEDQSLWITYNGEMFNYKEERRTLETKGHVFRTQSDTEVILHLYEEYGVKSFSRIVGQFALAIWNERTQTLVLARDHFGIKPLYFAFSGSTIAFASEIRPLLRILNLPPRINNAAVGSYFVKRYNTESESIYSGIHKLPAAHYAVYQVHSAPKLETHRYYSPSFAHTAKIEISPTEAAEEVRRMVHESVRQQLVADVEVGIFLSSGVDSSTILFNVAQFARGMKAFTISCGTGDDELAGAQELAQKWGADFHPLRIESGNVQQFINVVRCFDEPIGDSIILPTYLLAQAAARKVKVVLSGEGADEIFGGYIHHLLMFHIEKYAKHLPPLCVQILATLLRGLPPSVLSRFFPYPESLGAGDRTRISRILGSVHNLAELRRLVTSAFVDGDFAGPALKVQQQPIALPATTAASNYYFETMDADIRTWLPEYTLNKMDILTMANSLEGRVPFLDFRIADFVTQLPMSFFAKGTTVKQILRQAFRNDLPEDVLRAPKKAFYFPYHRFFGQQFVDFIRDLHRRAADEPTVKELINTNYFDATVRNFGVQLSLEQSKQLMIYVIFLTWYFYRFREVC